jgi:ATP-dependent DNA helicase RecG
MPEAKGIRAMTSKARELTSDQREVFLNSALNGKETQTLEVKRVSGKMVGKALETVCAFANTLGGDLFLGVEDAQKARGKDRLYGIDENPEAVDELLRKLETQFRPKIEGIVIERISCVLRDGHPGCLLLLRVPRSDKVHSIVGDGAWMRGEASNREMSADEIVDLSYQRGVRSAESEPVDVDFDLLKTDAWRLFLRGRGLSDTGIPDQLYRIGLAQKFGSELRPVRAAVLLFADYPGALLAASQTRADVRVFHYRGNAIAASEVPNLIKPPKTLSGPIYQLIAQTHAYVLDSLTEGLTLVASGFKTLHRYPERVIREAITNALIHRDYRLNQDVHIRIFDNRIEIVSPGLFPGKISAATIQNAGSFARNPLIASHLREFPDPPNVDAGEGVRMMFHLMQVGNLYPPQYREFRNQTQQTITVTLLNEERPPVWTQVSDWIDRNGPIGNGDLRQIAELDTLSASKLLKRWVEQGLLEHNATQGKRNRVYYKPSVTDEASARRLLSTASDNKR